MPDQPPGEYSEHITDIRLGVADCAQIVAWLSEIQPVSISTGHDTVHPSIAAFAGAVATDPGIDHVRFDSGASGQPDVHLMLFNDPFAALLTVESPDPARMELAARIAALCRSRAIDPEVARARAPIIELDASRLTHVAPEPAGAPHGVGPDAASVAALDEPSEELSEPPARFPLSRFAMTLAWTAVPIGVTMYLQLCSRREHASPAEQDPPAATQEPPASPAEQPTPVEEAPPATTGEAPDPHGATPTASP